MRSFLKRLFSNRDDGEPARSPEAAENDSGGEDIPAEGGDGSGPDDLAEGEPEEENGLPGAIDDPVTLVGETALDPLQTEPLEPVPDDPIPVISGQGSPAMIPEVTRPSSLNAAHFSHVGALRSRNEDAFFYFVSQSGGFEPLPDFGVFFVADGMGGHFDGHKASKVVSRTAGHHVLQELYQPLLRGMDIGNMRPVQEVLEEAVRRANETIGNTDPDEEMGTTLTGVLVIGNRLFLAHVGDSRAYLHHDGQLKVLSTDHSVVQALQDTGQITAEEAAVHPNRNLLYRALVGEPLEEIDTFTQTLPESGTVLLCSDGLWGLVSDGEMLKILESDRLLYEKAETLVRKALVAGGHDNITVLLVEFYS